MATDKVRVGLVGCGRIADLHAAAYRDEPNAEIVAVCDASTAVLEQRAEEWGVARTYERLDDLLGDPEVDLIEVLTPHHLHREMVVAAAKAGKHVSVQKPMALDPAECDEMITAALYAGVQLRVYENFVFYPPFAMARRVIEEGEIGEILSVRMKLGAMSGGWKVPLSTWLWRLDEGRAGPGPNLFDDGYHKFSMAVDLLGEAASVRATVDRTLGVIDSPAVVSMSFKSNQALAYFETSFSPNARIRSDYYGADERMEITGTRGMVLLNRCTGRLLDEPPLMLVRDGRCVAFENLRDDWQASFTDATHHFINALKDFRPPKLSGQTGKHLVQVALAAYRSADEARPVAPGEITGAPAS
ncbi:MAG: Gfo/Idh/MocA family oxidoreductase [Deltaproteobacteria bacterium]|nr:Gfo/Idh/MocA family oxidoreductase [Deltaproteobacteria bacterium]